MDELTERIRAFTDQAALGDEGRITEADIDNARHRDDGTSMRDLAAATSMTPGAITTPEPLRRRPQILTSYGEAGEAAARDLAERHFHLRHPGHAQRHAARIKLEIGRAHV